MFSLSMYNVTFCGIFFIILSGVILKRSGNVPSPHFNLLLIKNEGDISLFTLTQLLGFVLHSCIMLISLVGKLKPK